MEIILKGMGYSGHNTCVVVREENGKFLCRCLDTERWAECDMSQMSGDMYGACCPLYYKSEEELEQLVRSLLQI